MTAKEKVTLTLPSEVMDAVRALAQPRRQSQFIADAIHFYVEEQQRLALRERLIAGYQANTAADAALAAEWSEIEEESWRVHIPSIAHAWGDTGADCRRRP